MVNLTGFHMIFIVSLLHLQHKYKFLVTLVSSLSLSLYAFLHFFAEALGQGVPHNIKDDVQYSKSAELLRAHELSP